MKFTNRLSRRIMIAFVLMAAVISVLFSIGIIMAVQMVEKQLLTNTLHRELTLAIADVNAGRTPELEPGSRFYYGYDKATPGERAAYDKPGFGQQSLESDLDIVGSEPPPWLKNLHSGFHEVFREGQAYHALVYKQGDDRFLILRDQTDFEKREQALFLIVAGGFVLSVAAAWILGYLLARRILQPVARLASQVSHRDQLLALAPPLAPDYADDEVGQLAAAFDQTMDQLRESLERERLFTSDVSHELRTPLTVISTASELLLAADTLTDKQRSQLQRIRRASEDMRDLVRTFLLLARDRQIDTAQGQGGDIEMAPLPTIAQEEFQQWLPVAQAKQLVLRCDMAAHASGVAVYNAPLLRAVMSNLLRNAIHYTDQGYVALVLEPEGFRVEDSGRGIDPGEQEAVFQPFFRGNTARGEGLGLGLSLVRRICAHQGWHITLQAHAPQGSCFRVTFRSAVQ